MDVLKNRVVVYFWTDSESVNPITGTHEPHMMQIWVNGERRGVFAYHSVDCRDANKACQLKHLRQGEGVLWSGEAEVLEMNQANQEFVEKFQPHIDRITLAAEASKEARAVANQASEELKEANKIARAHPTEANMKLLKSAHQLCINALEAWNQADAEAHKAIGLAREAVVAELPQ